jgi:hypothetical protein
MKSLPILFARTKTGSIQQWSVELEDNKYRTIFGQVDGKIQTTKWTVCEVTNAGRANERKPEEQALFEAEALWKKKKDSGYFESINDIDVIKFVEPMLAKNFEEYSDKLKFPVYCQPKLDGCLHKDTLVTTDQGSAKIADVKVGMNVITFNEVLEKNELKKVKGVYKNAVDVQEKKQPQWYKITLENGEILTLTGNHRIWIKNLKCWRRVDELNGTEEILNIHQF